MDQPGPVSTVDAQSGVPLTWLEGADGWMAAGEWMQAGACRDMDTEVFFPANGDIAGVRAAKAICDGCPVKAECLDYAMASGEDFGIFGGLSARGRRRLRTPRSRSEAASRPPNRCDPTRPPPRREGVKAERAKVAARVAAARAEAARAACPRCGGETPGFRTYCSRACEMAAYRAARPEFVAAENAKQRAATAENARRRKAG